MQFSFRLDNCHTFLCKWEIVFLVYTYAVCVTFWIHVHIWKLKGFVVFKFLVPNMLIPCSSSGLANLRHAWPEWHAERWPWCAVPIFFLFLLPSQSLYIVKNMYMCVCVCVCVCIYIYTGCPRRNVPDFGRVFLMLKYTDITWNTYVQSWTVMEIMVREVWNFDSCYTLIYYQIHIKTGRNMWFL